MPFMDDHREITYCRSADGIPSQLRDRDQWITWAYGPPRGDGKPTKPPYSVKDGGPQSGRPCNATDPRNWTTFADAMALAASQDVGIGICLDNSGLVCVDLDDCLGRQDVTPSLVDRLDSWTEISASGQGLHVWCEGTFPVPGKHTGEIEVYTGGRFIAVTGRSPHFEPRQVAERTDALLELFEKLGTIETSKPVGGLDADADDAELFERAKQSRTGQEFERLWSGDISPEYALHRREFWEYSEQVKQRNLGVTA